MALTMPIGLVVSRLPAGRAVLRALHPRRAFLQADWSRRPHPPVYSGAGELLGAQARRRRHP